MKTRARKLLKKVPFAYHVARLCQEGYRSHVSMAGERRKTAGNVRIIRSMSNLAGELGLMKAVFSGRSVALWLEDGTAFRLYPDEVNPLLTIPLSGSYEPAETAFLMGRVRPGWTVLDVGANFGWYTVHFSKAVGREGVVHAFEPLPAVFEALKGNVALNGIKNVFLCNKAVGKSGGKLELFTPEDLGPAYSCIYPEGKKTAVGMTTLDEYVRQNAIRKVDFIKADIEGGEFNALIGAEKTLDRDHPDLFLEVQECHTENFGYRPGELFSFLESRGYGIFYIGPDGKGLKEVTDFTHLPSFNFFCTARKRIRG